MNAPLTAAEVKAGLARLMSSALMTSAEGRKDDYTGALDAASDVRSDMGPRLWPFAKEWGMKGHAPGVIEDLGVALLLSRLSVEELFRLGTSTEAIHLFEKVERHRAERMKAYHGARGTKATS